MGKKIERRATGISIERNHPGCMWGIVHALQHQPWQHVRKRMLPHRRRRGSENTGNDINAADGGELQEHSYAKMEKSPVIVCQLEFYQMEEQTGQSQSTKGSVKSRIKAFISEEMLKRRAKHRRSRSYPARMQLTRTDSIHRLRHSDFNHFDETPINDNSNISQHKNEKYSSSNSFKKQGNLLKEIEYRKSMSFPSVGFSGKRRRKFGSMEVSSDFLSTDLTTKLEPSDKDGENRIPKKRFKNLKERIKHAMRESKKERHRITMDAILHKVPYGRKFSNDERREIADFRREKTKGKCRSFKPPQRSCFDDSLERYRQLYFSCFNTEAKNHIGEKLKLTPSSGELHPKNMGRLFSLPDLRLYYLLKNEDFSGSISKTPNGSGNIKEISKSGNVLDEIERTDHYVSSENETLFDELVKCGHENRLEIRGDSNIFFESEVGSTSFVDFKVESLAGLGLDDLEGLTTSDENHDQTETIDTTNSLLLEDADQEIKQNPFDEEIFSQSFPNEKYDAKIDSLTTLINKPKIEKTEISIDISNPELAHVKVASVDISKFNFVKYVLELSGFICNNDILGAWHSPQQPLDPLMFEEFYEEDQHDENRDKVLLFDLINEVLLEIYEMSFAYCPIRLCLISYARPVPLGHHVLEEVWNKIKSHLGRRLEADKMLEEAVSRDLTRSDEWMNLHFEAECVGLELEDMIFEDLLEEII